MNIFAGLNEFVDFLEKHGGWPLLKGDDWNAEDWNWIEINKQMSNDGLPSSFLVDISVSVNYSNRHEKMIMVMIFGKLLEEIKI